MTSMVIAVVRCTCSTLAGGVNGCWGSLATTLGVIVLLGDVITDQFAPMILGENLVTMVTYHHFVMRHCFLDVQGNVWNIAGF